MGLVFKVMSESEWTAARASGAVAPAPVDIEDGYIHLSTEEQVLETARRHFSGRSDLVAVGFEAAALGAALKWEASRGGALFPHLYAELPAAMATDVLRLALQPSGAFVLGEREA